MADQLRHLRLVNTEKAYRYTATRGGGGEFHRPPRDRVAHARSLRKQLKDTERAARLRGLEPSDPRPITYELQPTAGELIKSLERQSSGIEILNVARFDELIRVTVLVPADKQRIVDGILASYETKIDKRSKRPRNQDLIENVDLIRLATERDLWTDNAPFPGLEEALWWEIWLYHSHGASADTAAYFRERAAETGMQTRDAWVEFPDRVVVLAHGTYRDWLKSPRLFLLVAELRRAKALASVFTSATPYEQKNLVQSMLARIQPPGAEAPAVCVLDSGVSHRHQLLAPGLSSEDSQALNPEWGTHDHHPHGHGTGMAGIALFGPLQDLLNSEERIVLESRLESVKILPPSGSNSPELYGAITQEAVARAASTAPDRARAVCLAVTADSRDGGTPSSWSAAIDQLSSGELSKAPTLVFIAAGNLRDQISTDEFKYPMINRADCGVEDPGQSWNAITVGAYTELVMISEADFKAFHPIAPAGDLSPTSRTSYAWSKEARDDWPLKPDLVMEGGNWAATEQGSPDTPDDLGLLTTVLKPTGALFTITRDTSPATAAAARMGARIMARYPELRPETVRGLMVHSARWTRAMIARFPGDDKSTSIPSRLRCYGYGVPDFDRAIHSTESGDDDLRGAAQALPARWI